MKQHITPKQLNELNNDGILKLNKWASKTRIMAGDSLLLSIGQMIEFLAEHGIPNMLIQSSDRLFNGRPGFDYGFEFTDEGWMNGSTSQPLENICDALWEMVKEVLTTK